MYFIGVTTSQSSIMRLFPEWVTILEWYGRWRPLKKGPRGGMADAGEWDFERREIRVLQVGETCRALLGESSDHISRQNQEAAPRDQCQHRVLGQLDAGDLCTRASEQGDHSGSTVLRQLDQLGDVGLLWAGDYQAHAVGCLALGLARLPEFLRRPARSALAETAQ